LEKILKKLYEKPNLYSSMRLLSKSIVILFGLGFLILGFGAYKVSLLSLIKVTLIALIPFVAVTVIRQLINAPRPYELYDFYEKKPKEKKGRSFPSRHVYSASVISVLTVFVYPILGGVMVFLTLVLAILRVLLGIHFIRDVVCGALIGAGAGLLGVLILVPF
jgi:membrane-associated phospholipid phosphatase